MTSEYCPRVTVMVLAQVEKVSANVRPNSGVILQTLVRCLQGQLFGDVEHLMLFGGSIVHRVGSKSGAEFLMAAVQVRIMSNSNAVCLSIAPGQVCLKSFPSSQQLVGLPATVHLRVRRRSRHLRSIIVVPLSVRLMSVGKPTRFMSFATHNGNSPGRQMSDPASP